MNEIDAIIPGLMPGIKMGLSEFKMFPIVLSVTQPVEYHTHYVVCIHRYYDPVDSEVEDSYENECSHDADAPHGDERYDEQALGLAGTSQGSRMDLGDDVRNLDESEELYQFAARLDDLPVRSEKADQLRRESKHYDGSDGHYDYGDLYGSVYVFFKQIRSVCTK